jgi:outer membrane usher protein
VSKLSSRSGRRDPARILRALTSCLLCSPLLAFPAAPATKPPPADVSSPAPPVAGAPRNLQELLVEADVNQQGLRDSILVLRDATGRFLFAADDLKRWRVRRPGVAPVQSGGMDFYPLAAIPDAKAAFDPAKQTIGLQIPADAFEETTEQVRSLGAVPPPVLPGFGGYLNYNLSSTRTAQSNSTSGLFELGLFDRIGAFNSSYLAPDLEHSSRLLRLETTFAKDYPGKLSSLRLGDTISGAGTWGLPVRMGGVQYRTNFGTQPGFIRSPISTAASGLATLPSVVDVFVNNALVSRQSVPPGPFSITNIPAVSGAGEVRLVVRDLLGREQIITQPFYRNLTLLRAGLEEFSYEAGFAREDFGVSDNHYGPGMAAATYKRGLTEAFTGEVHGEIKPGLADAGVSGSYLLGNVGLFNATVAASGSDAGTGGLGGVAFERQGRMFSFSAQSQWTTRDFRQLGMAPGQLPRLRQTSTTLGVQLGTWGSVTSTFVDQAARDTAPSRVLSVGYNLPLGRYAQLGVSALRSIGNSGGKTIFTTLAIPIDGTTSATLTRERSLNPLTGASTVDSILVQKSPPIGEGFGYRLQDRGGDKLGSFIWQGSTGTYQLEATQPREGNTATRLGIAGGVGMVGGKAFLSRSITESFGIVRVADYANVTVLQDNQAVAKTDADGYAVLPRLRSYDRNTISVNQNDIALDAIIQKPSLVAVPYFRTGVLLDFPVKRVRSGVLRVTDERGENVPSGALAHIVGSSEEFPVALRGELYLNGFDEKNRVVVKWNGSSCEFEVAYPKTADPLPNLGTFACPGIKF